MKYASKLRKNAELQLVANPVAVPELAHLFEKSEPTLFYISSLSALDKDRCDAAFVKYGKDQELTSEQINEIYRSFCIAYCLSDKDNSASWESENELYELVGLVSGLTNRIASRLWVVANGANRFTGADDVLKKGLEVQPPKRKNSAGNGESPSTSATPAVPLG